MSSLRSIQYLGLVAACLCPMLAACTTAPAATAPASGEPPAAVIVQGGDLEAVVAAVKAAGGEITHRLAIIRAAGARLTPSQRSALEEHAAVTRIWDDREVETSDAGGSVPYTEYPRLIGAEMLHAAGVTGAGVGVAVIDTGIRGTPTLTGNSQGTGRLYGYDATGGGFSSYDDGHGHGTHVASIIGDSRKGGPSPGSFNGVAPDVTLFAVKAFDDSGSGTYADAIRAVDVVVRYKSKINIRVLNLSFSAEPVSHYWDDPLNQAVMAAWQAGIVVVASAGNGGPDPMTVGVPGNVPYAITVGAMSDGVTPEQPADDFLASFSAAGPTVEGFVKPEVVAPGGHMLAKAYPDQMLPSQHPEWLYEGYLYMSGTPQAAAVVSGVVALLLQAEPQLTPDDVKCRLMSSARPAVDTFGRLAYSVFQQGAGMIQAWDAAKGTEVGCANSGLDVDLDLAGVEHYGGAANQDADGNYVVAGLEADGTVWPGGYLWTEGYLWTGAYFWTSGYLWTNGGVWTDAYFWTSGGLWPDLYPDGFLWTQGLVEPAAVNYWVGQE